MTSAPVTSARTASSRCRRDHRGYAVSEYPSDVDVALNLTLPSDQLTEVANAVRPCGRRFLTITYPVPQQEWIGRDDVALHFVLDMDGTFGGARSANWRSTANYRPPLHPRQGRSSMRRLRPPAHHGHARRHDVKRAVIGVSRKFSRPTTPLRDRKTT